MVWTREHIFSKVNDLLSRVERSFLVPAGLPGRPWFKHAIYAPGLTTGVCPVAAAGRPAGHPGGRRPAAVDAVAGAGRAPEGRGRGDAGGGGGGRGLNRLQRRVTFPMVPEQEGQHQPADDSHGTAWFHAYADRLDAQPVDLPLRCPCCYCLTLTDRGGFDICQVCFWEDDGQDDHDVEAVRGGPNGDLSLAEARANYRRLGACDEGSIPHVRPARPGELPASQL